MWVASLSRKAGGGAFGMLSLLEKKVRADGKGIFMLFTRLGVSSCAAALCCCGLVLTMMELV